MPLKKFKAKLVPDIKELNLFVKRNLLTTAMSGELASSLKGRGIEFEDYRNYSVEDDASRIDWRASQRSQKLLVREYKLDVNFNVFFLIDTSESMLFASTKKLKCEYAAEVACSIFYGILQTGNAVGFGLFNTALSVINKPLLGKKQFYYFSKEISNPKNYGGRKNLSKAIQQAMTILDKKALIFIVSDFIDLDKDWIKFVTIMSKQHEVIGIMVRDPRDNILPDTKEQLILEDPFSQEKMYIDTSQYAKLYNEYNLKQVNLIRSVFRHSKSNLMELTTDTEYLNNVLQFFRKSGGRWR